MAPPPSLDERLQRLREEWLQQQASAARTEFEQLSDADRAGHVAVFEAERLGDLAAPIAKAWRRDGVNSRIAASSFFRWLAERLWPGDVSDKQLLAFAMTRTV